MSFIHVDAMVGLSRPRHRKDFEIALICALRVEFDAVEPLFDEYYEEDFTYGKASGDPNAYTTGRICSHHVVLAHLPGIGKANSASAAASFRTSFTGIKLGIVVGVCGGIPFGKEDGGEVVLGDVIISTGLIQWDFGRQYPDRVIRKDTLQDNLSRPNTEIRAFLAKLSGLRSRKKLKDRTSFYIANLCAKDGFQTSSYPGADKDILFHPNYRHKHRLAGACIVCANCKDWDDKVCEVALESSCDQLLCDPDRLICRTRIELSKGVVPNGHTLTAEELREAREPLIHFGLIASGDVVMKSGLHRDQIASQEKVIAFEMEGAGVWDNFPTVVIKSVCDYADSHKNKAWQRYAAVSAAACMKAFLEEWRTSDRSLEVTDIFRTVQESQVTFRRSPPHEMILHIQDELEAARRLVQSTANEVSKDETVLGSIEAHFASLNEWLGKLTMKSDVEHISTLCCDLLDAMRATVIQNSTRNLVDIRSRAPGRTDKEQFQRCEPTRGNQEQRYQSSFRKRKDQEHQKARRRFVKSSSVATWLGKILASSEEHYLGSNLTYVITEILILPAPWLFRTRSALQIIRYKSIVGRESPKYSLRPIEMIPNNAPILSAIEARDISTATRLLSQRAVSPFALTVSGANLLEKLAEKMFGVLFDLYFRGRSDEEINRRPNEGRMQRVPPEDSDAMALYSPEEMRIREAQFVSMKELFILLASQGVDAAHRSDKGGSAISWLLTTVQFGADLNYEDSISFLLGNSLSAAKSNPLHIDFPIIIGDILVQYVHSSIGIEYTGLITTFLQDQEWTLCSDEGICVTNSKILMHIGCYPEPETEGWENWVPLQSVPLETDLFYRFFRRRREMMQLLTRNITENFEYHIEKEEFEVVAEVFSHVLKCMRTSLLYASPWKGLHANQHDTSQVRRMAVQEVVSLMDFVRSSGFEGIFETAASDGGPSMLRWCQEWEVLDLWMECYRRSGINVPPQTRKVWMEDRREYRYSDLLEAD